MRAFILFSLSIVCAMAATMASGLEMVLNVAACLVLFIFGLAEIRQ